MDHGPDQGVSQVLQYAMSTHCPLFSVVNKECCGASSKHIPVPTDDVPKELIMVVVGSDEKKPFPPLVAL